MNRLLSAAYDLDHPRFVEANRRGEIPPEQREKLGGILTWLAELLKGRFRLGLLFIVPWLCIFLFAGLASLDLPFALVFFLPLGAGVVTLFFVAKNVIQFFSWRRTLKKELQEGSVRHGTGKLVFDKNAFAFEVSDDVLRLPFPDRGDIEPGLRYTVHYLPESKTVISAEALGRGSERQIRQGLTEILAVANKFSHDALPENRRGRLHTGQLKLFLPQLISNLLLALIPIGFVVYQLSRLNFSFRFSDLDIGWALLLGIPGLIALLGLYRLVSTLVDVVVGWVESVEGMGTTKTKTTRDEGGSTTEYFYVVGDMSFEVKQRAYRAFEENRRYRVYYTPATKTMVNIEAL